MYRHIIATFGVMFNMMLTGLHGFYSRKSLGELEKLWKHSFAAFVLKENLTSTKFY